MESFKNHEVNLKNHRKQIYRKKKIRKSSNSSEHKKTNKLGISQKTNHQIEAIKISEDEIQ